MSQSDRVSVDTVDIGQRGDRILKGDLYVPPKPNGAGLLLIHGGGFMRGDRSQLRGCGIQLGRLGYISLAYEYRLAPENKWPAQINDVHTALARLHEIAPGLGVDRNAITVWGNSSGGHWALMAAALGEVPVAAAIALYAASDFLGPGTRAHGAPEAMTFLMGDDASRERLSSISPINYARPNFPPTLLMTGNQDNEVDWHDSLSMYLRLVDAGAQCELHIFGGAPHAFDALPAYGRQCVELAALFLGRHIEVSDAPEHKEVDCRIMRDLR
jgi:acetyl esterase/lipase